MKCKKYKKTKISEYYKRTPRDYDGTESTCKKLKDIVPFILKELERKIAKQYMKLIDAWPSICGTMFAKYTSATIKDDILIINVKNSTVLSQLHRNQHAYMQRIYELFPHKPVDSIKFRMI